MTTYLWSALSNGQTISPFNPSADAIRFDDGTINASAVTVATSGSSMTLSFGSKTVTVAMMVTDVWTGDVRFDNGSVLIVGDNVPGAVGDGDANTINGGAGSDQLIGLAGDDRLDGRGGADRLDGGAGNDYAKYYYAPAGVTVDLITPALNTGEATGDTYVSIEGVIGTPFADRLFGNNAANDIAAFDGDDYVEGRIGNDNLQGLNGNDILNGGPGGDRLAGGAGLDLASYASSTVPVTVNLASPSHNSGEASGDGYSSIEGLIGSIFNDTLLGNDSENTLRGADGNDTLYGLAGSDLLQGGNGTDFLEGGEGGDNLDGGAGLDYATYKYAPDYVVVNLANTAENTGESTGDTYTSIEGVVGSIYNDFLIGDGGAQDLAGLDGDDDINGAGGNDNLQGGNGQDTLDGGAGVDRLVGGVGAFFDTFVFVRGQAQGDVIADYETYFFTGALDHILCKNYGPGASISQSDASHYTIHSGDGLTHENITINKYGYSDGGIFVTFI